MRLSSVVERIRIGRREKRLVSHHPLFSLPYSLIHVLTFISIEKMNRDLDNLTPLDPRNSLLMEPPTTTTTSRLSDPSMRKDRGRFGDDGTDTNSRIYDRYHTYRSESPEDGRGMNMVSSGRRDSQEGLVRSAAGMPYSSYSQPGAYRDREPEGGYPGYTRQPTMPNIGGGYR